MHACMYVKATKTTVNRIEGINQVILQIVLLIVLYLKTICIIVNLRYLSNIKLPFSCIHIAYVEKTDKMQFTV